MKQAITFEKLYEDFLHPIGISIGTARDWLEDGKILAYNETESNVIVLVKWDENHYQLQRWFSYGHTGAVSVDYQSDSLEELVVKIINRGNLN